MLILFLLPFVPHERLVDMTFAIRSIANRYSVRIRNLETGKVWLYAYTYDRYAQADGVCEVIMWNKKLHACVVETVLS